MKTQREAIAKLYELTAGQTSLDVTKIFRHADVFPLFMQKLDMKTLNAIADDYIINPTIVWATQRSVDPKQVAAIIMTPVTKWFTDIEGSPDVPLVLRRSTGRNYLWDGHHRMSAALLLELPNLRCKRVQVK